MYFMIEDDDLLSKYNTICDKVRADIKKKLIASLSMIKNLKTNIESYVDEVTNFYGKKFPKVNSNHTCSAVISLDSASSASVSKSLKYIEKKVIRNINNNLSDFSYSDESDEG